jgi:hypothetical protein
LASGAVQGQSLVARTARSVREMFSCANSTPRFPLTVLYGSELVRVLTDGQRVVPRVLEQHAYSFAHADLDDALRAVLAAPAAASRSPQPVPGWRDRGFRIPLSVSHSALLDLVMPFVSRSSKFE